ncbi:MAG TPA: carbon dioxide concentrating mechanism protein, partial [Microcoleaceae cyanobacterium]
MSLPTLQLQPISTSHYYVNGDVTIQAGVAIAPGVLLQADPNSRIIVKTGACIGIGAILHAQNGV